MEILLFWLGFSVAVAVLASKYGRSAVGWFFLAALISPVLAGMFLLIASKTTQQKVLDALTMEELIAKHRQKAKS